MHSQRIPQRNLFNNRREFLVSHKDLLREHLSVAMLQYPSDVEGQNRAVMRRLVASVVAEAVSGVASLSDEDREAIMVQVCEVMSVGGRVPSPDTISRQIRNMRAEGNVVPYSEQEHWNTLAWGVRRARYVEMHGESCALDRNHYGPFNLHHKNYDRVGWELDSDLIMLCRPCHARHHGVQP